MDDPTRQRRDALTADIERAAELLAETVAEAVAIDAPVRRDVFTVPAILDGWVRQFRAAHPRGA